MHVQSFYLEPQQEKNRQFLKNQKMTKCENFAKSSNTLPFH